MLNDKSLYCNHNIYDFKSLISDEKNNRDYVPANKEWLNSIYTYNKNYNKNLSVVDNRVYNMLKDYFNINTFNGKKSSILTILENKLSLDKIIVSKAEIKHTNDKINLTVYIYNRHKITLLYNIYNFYYKSLHKTPSLFKKDKIKSYRLNKFFLLAKKNISNRKKYISLILENLKKRLRVSLNISTPLFNSKLNKYEAQLNKQYKNMLIEHRALYLYYINLLTFNNNKFKDWFLLNLKNKISQVYNKKVELNIVNLKYYHLNSDVLTEAIATKARNRHNPIIHVMKRALRKAAIPRFKGFFSQKNNFYKANKNPLLTSSHINNKNKHLVRKIYDSVKYKRVHGIRLEGAGRLTKRLTAARSISVLKYRGGLSNLDVKYNARSVPMLRGNIKPNLQYTNINSKTRNGSFGLKGWVSSH